MPKRWKNGDVFAFGEGRCGVGQIVEARISLWIVVFAEVINETDLNTITVAQLTPLLRGETMDARLHHGMWTVIGNDPFRHKIKWPHFVVPHFDDPKTSQDMLYDSFGNCLRPATKKEARTLSNPHSRSPIGFERMFWARNGIGEWDSEDGIYLVDDISNARRFLSRF